MLIHRNSTTNRVPPAFAVPSPRAPRVLLDPALAHGHEHANAALSIPPSPLYVGLGTNAHSTRASAHDAPRLVVRLAARRKIIRVDIPHVPFRGAARRPEKEQTSPQRSKVPTPPPHARTSSLPPTRHSQLHRATMFCVANTKKKAVEKRKKSHQDIMPSDSDEDTSEDASVASGTLPLRLCVGRCHGEMKPKGVRRPKPSHVEAAVGSYGCATPPPPRAAQSNTET